MCAWWLWNYRRRRRCRRNSIRHILRIWAPFSCEIIDLVKTFTWFQFDFTILKQWMSVNAWHLSWCWIITMLVCGSFTQNWLNCLTVELFTNTNHCSKIRQKRHRFFVILISNQNKEREKNNWYEEIGIMCISIWMNLILKWSNRTWIQKAANAKDHRCHQFGGLYWCV